MPQLDSKEEEEDDFFAPKPLFGDDNDLGVIVSSAKQAPQHKEDHKSNVITDDNGHVTAEDWSINKIIKKSNMAQLIKNKNKKFNPQTTFWKFLKSKVDTEYNYLVSCCTDKVNQLIQTQSSLIKNMSFDDISAIVCYTTEEVYRALNKSLRNRSDEWAPFCGPLLSGLNKLPFVWTKLYRGTKSKTLKKYLHKYKTGAILRWDSFSSTSSELSVAESFATSEGTIFEVEHGFRGRDIDLFSACQGEKEILFSISSHFIITKIYKRDKRDIIVLKEIPFPWDFKTILWVDDRPTNNKELMEEFEAKGIMVIPRVSTYGAKEFLDFTKNAISLSMFSKFRVITDMKRYEYPQDDSLKEQVTDRYAGVTLIEELRTAGYNNKVCIYTGSKEKAIDKCKEKNVYDNRVLVTVDEDEVESYASFE
eukprot:489372_1